jgi:hypothetical protein
MFYIEKDDITNISEPGDYWVLCSGFVLLHFDGTNLTKYTPEETTKFINEVFKRIEGKYIRPSL